MVRRERSVFIITAIFNNSKQVKNSFNLSTTFNAIQHGNFLPSRRPLYKKASNAKHQTQTTKQPQTIPKPPCTSKLPKSYLYNHYES